MSLAPLPHLLLTECQEQAEGSVDYRIYMEKIPDTMDKLIGLNFIYSHGGCIDQGSLFEQGFGCLLNIILQDTTA